MTEAELDRINRIPMNFIMGRERSGTTLLQAMLNAHPHIIAPTESRFILLWYSRYGSVTKWTEKIVRKFITDLYSEKLFSNFWSITKDELLDSLLSVKNKLTYPLLCKAIYFHAARGKDVKLFSDKNPVYCYFIPQLQAMFPDAKYIHIVRDYRDNILSAKKVFAIKDAAYMAYYWKSANTAIEEVKIKSSESWVNLHYETLVSEPVKSMLKICNFFGILFDEKMTQAHPANIPPEVYKNSDNPRVKLFHENLFKPIDASRIGQWKEKMPAEDLAIAEAIAGEYAEKMYDYTPQLSKNKAFVSKMRLFKARLKYAMFKNTLCAAIRTPWLYSLLRFFWILFMKQ